MLAARHHGSHAVVHRNVGAAEPVDRLLRVADQCELPFRQHDVFPSVGTRLELAEIEDYLGLQRVRVLEFVHEDVVEHPLVFAPRRLVLRQQVAEPHEQVELIKLTASRLHLFVKRQDDGKQAHQPRRYPAVERSAQPVPQPRLVELPHFPRRIVAHRMPIGA